MHNAESIEQFLLHHDYQYETVDETTWLLQLTGLARHAVMLRVQQPICLVSASILKVDENTPKREELFCTLLRLNAATLHCGYVLDGDQIVLSGSQQLENLDANELQALLDDMTMALDNQTSLSPWLEGQ